MSSMSLQQIQSRLEKIFFEKDERIVFWYDEGRAFAEEYEKVALDDVTKIQLKFDEQFKTKIQIERENPEVKYLLYVTYPPPIATENHFLDMQLYSVSFYTDRVSMLMAEEKIGENVRETLTRHTAFFNAAPRRKRFTDFAVKKHNVETAELALLCAVASVPVLSLEELLKSLLTTPEDVITDYFNELEKYNLTTVFWDKINRTYEYHSESPTLLDFATQLFITYMKEQLAIKLPSKWSHPNELNPSNTKVLLDSLMYDSRYESAYQTLSQSISRRIGAEKELALLPLEFLLPLNLFSVVDEIILSKLQDMLSSGNLRNRDNGKTVEEICHDRENLYYGEEFFGEYHAVKYAYRLLSLPFQFQVDDLPSGTKRYTDEYYRYDLYYRKFVFYFDTIPLKRRSLFEELHSQIENVYTHRYLDSYLPLWGKMIGKAYQNDAIIKKQADFYRNNISPRKERVVVIISDALRFEVATELKIRMNRNAKMDVDIGVMLANLPTITAVGMASLLPHEQLKFDGKQVLVDGFSTSSLAQREKILQTANEKSVALRYSDIQQWKQEELRERFIGQQVIYIYHDQIDAIGDDSKTHHDVFKSCEDTIVQIEALVSYLTNRISATNFILTADHGFLYKRDAIEEDHKIENHFTQDDVVSKRFALSQKPVELPGIVSLEGEPISLNIGGNLSFPLSSHIFKSAGGSQNYVHGGISPQEMLVPLLTMSTSRGKKETDYAKISPVIMPPKITNLVTRMEFVQNEAISDVVLPADYLLYFQADTGEIISSTCSHRADSKASKTKDRIFSFSFELKDRKYSAKEKYHLVIKNEASDYTTVTHPVKIEILFSGDFKF